MIVGGFEGLIAGKTGSLSVGYAWESARRPGAALSRSKHEAYDASYAVPLTSKDKRRLAR